MRSRDVIDQRFELEMEVSAGGMGRVFRALDRHQGRRVAVKMLDSIERAQIERFRRESALLAELRHPGIVEYVADGEIDGRHYLVMEWLQGEDLAHRLSRIPADSTCTLPAIEGRRDATDDGALGIGLSLAEVVSLARRTSSALAAIHRRGLVHRDVKPSNIFLVDGDVARAKLIDFGTARESAPLRPLTAEGMMIGTPRYMAPEQVRGRDVGPAADVWGLGCVLYECLTGRAPFWASHPLASLSRILVEDPLDLVELRPETPRSLAAFITSMLSKDASRRPPNGQELLDGLARMDLGDDGHERTGPVFVALPSGYLRDTGTPRPPTGPHSQRSGLTTNEARVRSLLFARGCPSGATLPALRELVAQHGGRLEPLAEGSGAILATIGGVHATKDQAARVALLALALRAADPGQAIVVATGRSADDSEAPVGQMFDRAIADLIAARAGEIHLDRVTAGLLEGRFELAGDADHALLVRERAAEGARTLLGKPSRWVGRRRELAMLTATFDECVEDRVARAVLVTAPPGVGKSRLRHEFIRGLTSRGAELEILYGQGDSLSAGSPFVMIAPAIRRSAGILDGEPLEICREKLLARLRRSLAEPDLTRVAALLGELVGVAFPDEGNDALRAGRADPMLLGDQMRGAWERWLRAESARCPVVLVLEDIHWGDLPSITFVDAALRALADRPFLVLALARPEAHPVLRHLKERLDIEEVRLHELPSKACAEIIVDALGPRATPTLIERLVARSEGNALYLEELVRAVAEGTVDALPDTVIGMVQARLSALDAEARRVLRAAAVFGEVFWEGGVRALLGVTTGVFGVGEWLADLTQREVITLSGASRLPGEREYKFRHALVRDAAYGLLTEHDRALGHLLAGEWLVEAGERDALVLASHFGCGDDCERAVQWFHRAAEQALEGNDLAAVTDCAERAVAAGASGPTLGALRGMQSVAFYWRSEYAEALRCGSSAISLLPSGSGDWFRAAASAIVSSARLGDDTTVDRLFDQAMRAQVASGAEAAQLICLARGAFQLIFHGRFERADEVLARIGALAAATPELDALTRAEIEHVQGLRAAYVGDVRTFLMHLQAALAAWERAGDVRNLCLERTTVAWVCAEIGDFARGEELCVANLQYCQRLRAQQAVTYAKVNLGYILMNRPGRLDDARRALLEAIEECNAAGNARLEGWARAHLAVAELRAGNGDAAEEHAAAAAGLLRATPGLQSWALAAHARALLALGHADVALDQPRRAMDILQRLGGLLEGESLPPLTLAEALHAAGDRDGARAAIGDARARLSRRAQRLVEASWQATFLATEDNARTLALHDAWNK